MYVYIEVSGCIHLKKEKIIMVKVKWFNPYSQCEQHAEICNYYKCILTFAMAEVENVKSWGIRTSCGPLTDD